MRVAYCSTVGYLYHRVQFTGNEASAGCSSLFKQIPTCICKGIVTLDFGCGVDKLGYGAQLVIIVGGSW